MIGLIPIGGRALRFNGLPKYLLPVPGGTLLNVLEGRMIDGGATQLLVGANADDFNLIARNVTPGGVVMPIKTDTMSETVLTFRVKAGDEPVLFGMPDTYWTGANVYEDIARLLDPGIKGIAAAALWRVSGDTSKHGMCWWNPMFHITEVVDKPTQTDLSWAWGAMGWKPEFWQYIKADDPHVGFAMQRAIEAGEIVHAVLRYCTYWNCGTAEDYFDLVRTVTVKEPA